MFLSVHFLGVHLVTAVFLSSLKAKYLITKENSSTYECSTRTITDERMRANLRVRDDNV